MFKKRKTDRRVHAKPSPVQQKQRELFMVLGRVTALGPWMRSVQNSVIHSLGPQDLLAHRITQLEEELVSIETRIRDELSNLEEYRKYYEQHQVKQLSLQWGRLDSDGTFKGTLQVQSGP